MTLFLDLFLQGHRNDDISMSKPNTSSGSQNSQYEYSMHNSLYQSIDNVDILIPAISSTRLVEFVIYKSFPFII
jgi:hypothetical protein